MDFQDNSQAVKAQLDKNIAKTLTAMGYKWQEIVTMGIDMQPRFGPDVGGAMGIVDTGRLIAYFKNVTL